MVKAVKGVSKVHMRVLQKTHHAPMVPVTQSDKGEYMGRCNRTSCVKEEPALWYNHSTRRYYCSTCADLLNTDKFNQADAQKLFGHDLCTEGQYDPNYNYQKES
jgi:hypothetical protein